MERKRQERLGIARKEMENREQEILTEREKEREGGELEFLFVCLLGFLTSSSTTRLYHGRAPRQSV